MEGKNPRHLRDHVLVVDRARGPARALMAMLEASGYLVVWMPGIPDVLAYSRDLQPNLILIGAELGASDAVQLCGALRDPSVVGAATPLVLVGALSAEERLAAFAAGAWECLAPPYNLEEVSARLAAFVAATREARHLRTQGLVAQVTGFSTHAALVRRVREMSGQAIRQHSTVACVVLSGSSGEVGNPALEPDVELLARSARALRRVSRASDVLGYVGTSEFVILMPAANDNCAVNAAERGLSALEHVQVEPAGRGWASEFRAGYCVFPDAAIASSEWGVIAASMSDPAGLIGRARQAARAAHMTQERNRVRRYSENRVPRPTPADGVAASAG